MMLDITCRSFGIKEAEATFDLNHGARLNVRVVYQSDRFYRVGAVWFPSGGADPVSVLRGFDTYLDQRGVCVVSAEDIARNTSPRMFAHTIHGSDYRKLHDAGTVR